MNFFDVFCPDKRKPSVTVRLLCATLYSITPVAAQNRPLAPDELIVAIKRDLENNPPKTIVKPSDTSVPLGAVTTPDGELWTEQNGYRVIRNVTQPALYPVRPTPDSANGTAVVIAPGGGFMSLAFDTEGMLVAKQLAAHGVTCFVLKYRLLPTPSDTLGYAAMIAENVASMDPNTINVPIGTARLPLSAQEDGLAAMRWVREHAKEFGISRERIGMLGFSAGGATTMAVATAYDATTRPDFIGVVYGYSPLRPVRGDAPPAFIAFAADDPLLAHASIPIFDRWRAAGRNAELHVYASGGHGFGMRKSGATADNWITQFTQWLQVQGLIR